MSRDRLFRKFPPSQPCDCAICLSYCRRPGWWTVHQASMALQKGLSGRMMLELSPDFGFGVLSPAFKGNENEIAVQAYAQNGCTFLQDNLCELFGSGLEPLECRFTHHARVGMGAICHQALEADWRTPEGQQLVIQWCERNDLFARYGLQIMLAKEAEEINQV